VSSIEERLQAIPDIMLADLDDRERELFYLNLSPRNFGAKSELARKWGGAQTQITIASADIQQITAPVCGPDRAMRGAGRADPAVDDGRFLRPVGFLFYR
jgi:hypothetical protein